jgi:hypothetical protein
MIETVGSTGDETGPSRFGNVRLPGHHGPPPLRVQACQVREPRLTIPRHLGRDRVGIRVGRKP